MAERMELNYTQPLPGKNIAVETGAKQPWNTTTSVNDIYLLNLATNNYDYSASQSFNMDFRNVYAGYLSVKFNLFKFWM